MKHGLLIIATLLTLSGCANLFSDRFDNVEYGMLVQLNVDSITQRTDCPLKLDTYKKSLALKIYSEGTMNDTSKDIYNEIHGLVDEFYTRENPSPVYCDLKWDNIQDATTRAIELTGSRIKK